MHSWCQQCSFLPPRSFSLPALAAALVPSHTSPPLLLGPSACLALPPDPPTPTPPAQVWRLLLLLLPARLRPAHGPLPHGRPAAGSARPRAAHHGGWRARLSPRKGGERAGHGAGEGSCVGQRPIRLCARGVGRPALSSLAPNTQPCPDPRPAPPVPLQAAAYAPAPLPLAFVASQLGFERPSHAGNWAAKAGAVVDRARGLLDTKLTKAAPVGPPRPPQDP